MDASGGGRLFQSPAPEDETIARKRSRRVSFADTTAVHVFQRDEDFETPPEERPASPSPSPAAEGDETEEGDEEFVRAPFGFLGDVDLDSDSPASAAGSLSSFDGDGNFFGVVSTSFIQPGRPSDSGMSEDNYHDQTLDSHTFSMHYNNLIPPDDCSAHSAGSLRLPDLESTTPLKELKGSESVKSSAGRDGLTDMSLCAENAERYDYTKLSPTLNNLLQEVQEPESPKDGANQIMNSETVLHTPRTLVQPLPISQGSVSSLRSKRQQVFTPIPHSTSNAADQEAGSLGSEFRKHGKRISALGHVLKFRLNESPAPPRQELNEATEFQDTSCNVLALPNREHNSHMDSDGSGRKRSSEENVCAEHALPEKRAKGPRSPITSQKQLPCVSLSSRMAEENQSEPHDSAQSLGDDCNKVVFTVSSSLKQMRICPASISKLNPQQLDMFGDKLGKIHAARKYKRLAATVRIQDSRLAEARCLHDKLLHEKTKLQINSVKLDKLQNKAQLCHVGIQECSYLKSKISQLRRSTAGATQDKGGPLGAATSINAQEVHARIAEKKLVLSMVQKKAEKLKSSLEHFCNIKGDIGEVVRVAEEQLEMRNRRQIISQQASLWTLNDIVKRENKRDVILNYHNLLFQRIILNISDMSTIFVSNSLLGSKIEQAFPNLNASVAFNFVFKAEENQRLSDLRSLQKKSMETSLLLGNLVDVLDEIDDAKGELLNLTSANFSMDSQTGQLIFSLRFMSYKSAKRVAFTIDMTDLSRAVYPAEPSELPIKVCQAQTTLSQPSVDKLTASIRDLQPGRTMILRLCRMLSRLVNTLPV
ncbi:uncharacterized protein LOC124695847 isoform X1 [Lolium rigidum]|uniref:uncharacterized protein LOC124695847 isoform X1 n=1 Tax=Lolium rigidum TaxID=89674 RepID=UPI001F5D4C30|nr:uncharacterized protein LOC124695847 isoform X1 [Lolium rigidum]